MKELSIEEKAKRYDEIINEIKNLRDILLENGIINENGVIYDNFNRIFPELKESEDERIKKELLSFLKEGKPYHCPNSVKRQEWAAWVEKQGNNMGISEETKRQLEDNLNKALEKETPESWNKFLDEQGEPKFKVEKDKWYVCTSQYCNCIEGRNYKASLDGRIIDDYGTEYDIHDDAYRWFRPWTIQDTKDGDVLSYRDGQWIFIYKEKIDDSSFCYHTLYSTIHQDLTINDSGFTLLSNAIVPATKEQRDLLFQKMKEAGYEWDTEKKELKKIVAPIFNIGDTIIKKHNSDIYDFGSFTITDITGGKYRYNDRIICDISEQDEWEIYEPVRQNPTEWSEEDDIMVHDIDYALRCQITYPISRLRSMSTWIDNLKNRIQPKQEWSEEDIATISRVISIVKWAAYSDHSHPILNDEGATELIERLKSLKERYTWKPSDEQLKLLKKVIDAGYYTSYPYALETLYEQLKQF